MKRKYKTLISLLIAVHLIPILQSCPGCEYEMIYVPTEKIEYTVGYQDHTNYHYESPYLRDAMLIRISLAYSDTINYYDYITSGILASCFAFQGCDDYRIEVEESIETIEIFEIIKQKDTVDRSTQFLTRNESDNLYTPIDSYLGNHDVKDLWIYNRYVPDGDTLNLNLKVTLSDQRVFSESFQLALK